MSAADVATLMDMGATRMQAVKALAKYKGVMEAAEAIFADEVGQGDEGGDEAEDKYQDGGSASTLSKQEDTDDEADVDDEEGDSYYDDISLLSDAGENIDFDPYKGIDMSKDRTKVVIELEQAPNKVSVVLQGKEYNAEQMTQAQWMQGCPEGSEQSHLFALYQALAETKPQCPKCHQPAQESSKGLLLTFESVQDYYDYVQENVQPTCSKCQVQYCIACQAPVIESQSGSFNGVKQGKHSKTEANLWHCGELQAVLLGVGLAHVQQLTEEPAKRAADQVPIANKKTKVMDEYGGNYRVDNGTGYAGAPAEDRRWHIEQKQKQLKMDKLLRQSLQRVREFLPNTSRASPVSSDYMPHVVSIAQIRRRLLPIVSRLLQSDSLVDMSERYELYHEVMAEWFRAFASNEALVPLLAQPIFLATKTEYKMQKDKSREKHVTYKGSNGPRELAQSIVMQCNDFLVNIDRHNKLMPVQSEAEGKQGETKDDKEMDEEKKAEQKDPWMAEEQRLCLFARRFVEEVATIDRILRVTKGDAFLDKLLGLIKEPIISQTVDVESVAASRSEDQDSAKEIATYEAWAKSQCYDECDMRQAKSSSDSPSYIHAFDTKIRSTDSSSNHKRGFTIAKELAGLRVSLPSLWNGSIFLRVDESRLDVLKACVVGPENTPYQNGLFMFDIYLPLSYNHTNPEVKLVTTARGTVRFNPNLYACGKVCLSLLGTWAGPGWISGQSTLLQVLISIQSLVMGVEEPALNEPGWSTYAGKPRSIAYTKNCRRQTIAVAMLNHLKDPDAVWKDVIEGHFRLKANSIGRQLDKWLKEDDGKPNSGDGTSYMHDHHSKQADGAGASQSKVAKDVAAIKTYFEKLKKY